MALLYRSYCLLFVCVISSCYSLDQTVVRMSQGIIESTETAQVPKFRFASYYGSHMVLQRAPQRATLWGFHPDPGYRVIVQVKGRQIYKALVDKTYKWQVLLEAESSAGPFTIVAMTETETIQLDDVLFGDVWLCSGQSNMAFTLNMAFNGTEEIEAAAKHYQNIRIFTAEKHYSKQPLDDLISVAEKWSLPSNSTLGKTWDYFSAVCWLFGKAVYEERGYPIGLISSVWGGTCIQSWMSPDALQKCGIPVSVNAASLNRKTTSQTVNVGGIEGPLGPPLSDEYSRTQLWNAMIHPFLPLTLYGIIWDQGESDGTTPATRNVYNCTFPAMIDDWRAKFSQVSGGQTSSNFPFGFVQIGSTIRAPEVTEYFTDIRWHQTADYGYVPNPRMKNVFMAVSLDIADFNSPYYPVHTRDKEDIAHRLALGGLSVAYNVTRMWSGPLPIGITVTSQSLVLDYGSTWTLQIRQSEGFEVCCSKDGSRCTATDNMSYWTPVPIFFNTSTTVTLYTDVCHDEQSIVGLRYLWRLSPCEFKKCAVYSQENELPAPPFVTFHEGYANKGGWMFELDWSKPVNV